MGNFRCSLASEIRYIPSILPSRNQLNLTISEMNLKPPKKKSGCNDQFRKYSAKSSARETSSRKGNHLLIAGQCMASPHDWTVIHHDDHSSHFNSHLHEMKERRFPQTFSRVVSAIRKAAGRVRDQIASLKFFGCIRSTQSNGTPQPNLNDFLDSEGATTAPTTLSNGTDFLTEPNTSNQW